METKPTVYIETTIVSYLTARPSKDPILFGQQEETKLWWETRRIRYSTFTSDLVELEAGRGDPSMARNRLTLLAQIPFLFVDERAGNLMRDIFHALKLPPRAAADALHLAIAAVHQVDFLLTWNCTHLANPHLLPRITRVCLQHGVPTPRIVTPSLLMELP